MGDLTEDVKLELNQIVDGILSGGAWNSQTCFPFVKQAFALGREVERMSLAQENAKLAHGDRAGCDREKDELRAQIAALEAELQQQRLTCLNDHATQHDLTAAEALAAKRSEALAELYAMSHRDNRGIHENTKAEDCPHPACVDARAALRDGGKEEQKYAIRWARSDGDVQECRDLTARTAFARLLTAIKNNGAVTVLCVTALTPEEGSDG